MTPRGRGRLIPSESWNPIHSAKNITTTYTRRCRQRRKTTSAAIVLHRIARIVHRDPRMPSQSIACVSQPVRSRASAVSSRDSQRSSAYPRGLISASPTNDRRNRPTIHIQNRPVRPRSWGSGGASPEGRRRRAEERPSRRRSSARCSIGTVS